MNRLAIALLCILPTACAYQKESSLEQVWPNEPGVTRLKDEQTTWHENDCDKKVLPFLAIKHQDLLSSVLQAGQELKHRFFYVACVSDSSKPIKGTLSRKILVGGRLISQDVSKHVEVKSGEWANVAFIEIPPSAKPGDYNFRLSFSIPNITINKELPFAIKK
jgi:hypothetical protein